MRTDAKVGLICALALAIAVVAYFALHNQSAASPVRSTSAEPGVTLTTTTPPSDSTVVTPPTVVVAPPAAVATAGDTSLVPAPTTSIAITPPAAHPMLPPTTAPSTGLMGGTPTTMPSTLGRGSEVPYNDRPGTSTGSLLERSTTPHPTIGDSGGTTSFLPSGSGSTYTIQKGDMLGAIAKKYGTTAKAIEAANPKINPNNLKINSVINIPAASSTSSITPPATRPDHSSTGATATTYTVKKGDSLRKIAKSVYGDEAQWKKIFQANRGQLDSADDIDVGMVLKIPAK